MQIISYLCALIVQRWNYETYMSYSDCIPG